MADIPRKVLLDALEAAEGNVTAAARNLGIPRGTLRAKLGQVETEGVEEKIELVEEHRLKKENKELRQQLEERLDAKIQYDDYAALMERIARTQSTPTRWLKRKALGREVAAVTAVLSDTHYDEVVFPEQINGVNEYNREIATQRTENFFQNTIKLAQDYINGIDISGIVLPLLGDMVSGNIHEELKETNEHRIIDTCLYYSDLIVAGIRLLSEHFPYVHIPCVPGNHGRIDKKPRAKHRAQDSFDYLIYHLVARGVADLDTVTTDISAGADVRWEAHGTPYVGTHGDQFRGGSGIAGALSPMLLGDARKRKRESAVGSPYHYMVMGHWHQLMHAKGIISNGSIKGYDEYAFVNNFDFEPPQQAFWLTDAKHGKTITAPVLV